MASTLVPMGMRFHLSDEEKMSRLLQKVIGIMSCDDDFIGTADLFGQKEPWEVFGDSEETEELYFFTELKKVCNNNNNNKTSKRFSRNVGKGTWLNKGQKTAIYSQREQVIIGYKRCYRYGRKNNNGDDRHGIWLLKEYVLPEKVRDQVKEEFKDYALCVLKKKKEKKMMKGANYTPQLCHVLESGSDIDMLFEEITPPPAAAIVNVNNNNNQQASSSSSSSSYRFGENNGVEGSGLVEINKPTLEDSSCFLVDMLNKPWNEYQMMLYDLEGPTLDDIFE